MKVLYPDEVFRDDKSLKILRKILWKLDKVIVWITNSKVVKTTDADILSWLVTIQLTLFFSFKVNEKYSFLYKIVRNYIPHFIADNSIYSLLGNIILLITFIILLLYLTKKKMETSMD